MTRRVAVITTSAAALVAGVLTFLTFLAACGAAANYTNENGTNP